jgi:hypothetical protein
MTTDTASHHTIPPALALRPCLGCRDCRGLCRDVLELSTLPDVVLHLKEPRP